MKKNLLLFVILLLPLFSVSSESVATAVKIDKHFFSSRENSIPWKIPSDLIEPVLEESEEEEEEEENLEENQQPLSCLLRGGSESVLISAFLPLLIHHCSPV